MLSTLIEQRGSWNPMSLRSIKRISGRHQLMIKVGCSGSWCSPRDEGYIRERLRYISNAASIITCLRFARNGRVASARAGDGTLFSFFCCVHAAYIKFTGKWVSSQPLLQIKYKYLLYAKCVGTEHTVFVLLSPGSLEPVDSELIKS